MPIKRLERIIVTGDFLMSSNAEQASNLRWLKEILHRPLMMGSPDDVQVLSWNDPVFSDFDRNQFFSESEISLDPSVAQFDFRISEIGRKSMELIGKFIRPGDLLVGYELSHQTRRVIHDLGAAYVDIWLHPVRFMDDIMFAVGASSPAMQGAIRQWEIPQSQMAMYADRLRVQAFKGWERSELSIQPGTAVFIGQMNNDKSVCKDGRFLEAVDYAPQLEDLARKHTEVLYLRHPYLKEGDERVLEYLETMSNVTVASLPAYKVIAHPNVRTVASISSSMLEEARLMGKDTLCFYRPVVPLFQSDNPDNYASIMHGMLSPKFWAEAFVAAFSNASSEMVPHTEFDSPKDKIRDMLGFYWSYSQVDKLESLRRSAVTERTATAGKTTKAEIHSKSTHAQLNRGFQKSAQSKSHLESIKVKIQAAHVISFDIFDTLLERQVRNPSDLFELLSERANRAIETCGGSPIDFVAERKESRNIALGRAHQEEVLLNDRYAALAEKHGWPNVLRDDLFDAEIAAEKHLLRPRWAGRELFDYARALGKRIILTSDTYFHPKDVRSFLSDAGFHADALYLSSEHGRLKATGRLFEVVIDHEQAAAGDILHIGDNLQSDIERGHQAGLSVAHLPATTDVYDAAPQLSAAHGLISDPKTRTLVQGMASTALSARPYDPETDGITGGHPSVLGYAILGPMFMGFANWILETARNRGIKDLYFLARDGEIAMTCCKALRTENDAPRIHYIPASRRSTRTASIKSETDILKVLDTPFDRCSLRTLLSARFGLDSLSQDAESAIRSHQMTPESLVSLSQNREALQALLVKPPLKTDILNQARRERVDLKRAYETVGLSGNRTGSEIAFVDVGHGGTIQSAICEILGLEGSYGLYFSTYDSIDSTLRPGGHQAESYFADRLHSSNSSHPYKRHLRVFESVFLNSEDSFIRFNGIEKVMETHATSAELQRKGLADELHYWITTFCRDWARLADHFDHHAKLPGHEATQAFLAYLGAPRANDAAIFELIPFDDSFNARESLWVVPGRNSSDASQGIWKEGTIALLAENRRSTAEKHVRTRPHRARNLTRRIIAASVALFVDDRLQRKFQKRPYVFFRDSKNAFARAIGAAAYGGRE